MGSGRIKKVTGPAGGSPIRPRRHSAPAGGMGRPTAVTRNFFYAHPTAVISGKAHIGRGTKIWAFAQIREDATIGKDCVIGNGVYIDKDVRIGDRVNIHNKALLYRNLVVEDDVFIGPGVCFTNDATPRANRIRQLGSQRWVVGKGASIGANACLLPGVHIGRYAMVGAGSLVSKDVPEYGLVYGVPAKLMGSVDAEGRRAS